MRQHPNSGGPAYPSRFTNQGDRNVFAPDGQVVPPGFTVEMQGMSLRDWFAGKALIGILAAHGGDAEIELPTTERGARLAYLYADAMLAERSKSEGR